MKRIMSIVLVTVLGICLVSCGNSTSTASKENVKEESKKEKSSEKKEVKTYSIGEKVSVKTSLGEYIFVVNSIEESSERNEFSDKKADRVIIISYTYENISYSKDLYISDINFKLYDKANTKMETYPTIGTGGNAAISTGRNITAKSAFALNSAENYVELEYYDNMFNSSADCKFVLTW